MKVHLSSINQSINRKFTIKVYAWLIDQGRRSFVLRVVVLNSYLGWNLQCLGRMWWRLLWVVSIRRPARSWPWFCRGSAALWCRTFCRWPGRDWTVSPRQTDWDTECRCSRRSLRPAGNEKSHPINKSSSGKAISINANILNIKNVCGKTFKTWEKMESLRHLRTFTDFSRDFLHEMEILLVYQLLPALSAQRTGCMVVNKSAHFLARLVHCTRFCSQSINRLQAGMINLCTIKFHNQSIDYRMVW